MFQFTVTSPAFVPQLHLELQVVLDPHEVAVHLFINFAPSEVEKVCKVLLIFDHEVKSGVASHEGDALPHMEFPFRVIWIIY